MKTHLKHSGLAKLMLLAAFAGLFFTACKKDPKVEPEVTAPSKVGTRDELTKDSIFLYAKETYFWNDVLPAYEVFLPRKFADFNAELNAIKAKQPLDKFSFLDDGGLADELGGVSGDYGFSVFYNSANDLRIKYVYGSSPASVQGLKRGYQITKINNRTDLNSQTTANIDFVVNAVFGNLPSISMTVKKPDGTSQDVTVNRGGYNLNPILFTNVYTTGSKKVGYIVYNSFTTNSGPALQNAFSAFSGAGVSEVIVDLRYNGGGSVATAEVLTNLIAPTSQTGNTMYTTYWTKTMQDNQAPILANQPLLDENDKLRPFTGGVNGKFATYADIDYKPTVEAGNVTKFAKNGSANVSRAYFIVTSGTASASELVINNLKPVMDVKLIGSKTYGKPVGFFAIHIDKLDMYIPNFETRNSQNFGGYYDGLAVDRQQADDVTKEFGDPSETLLALALGYATNGTFSVRDPNTKTFGSTITMSAAETERLTNELGRDEFKGMVETRFKLKK